MFGRIGQAAAAVLFLVAGGGCGGSKPPAVAGAGGGPARVTSTAARVPGSAEVLPFIHDDFPRALAEAKQKQKPLFVDAWAPWCHSCQSLRTFVLTDPMLAPLAKDFVWLSVDTEKDDNVAFVAQHPHAALPTLWVIDPTTDRAILKWAGTVTAEELRGLLTVAVADAKATDGSGSPGTGSVSAPGMEAMSAFIRGNHALAGGDIGTATREHRAALAAAGKDHPQRARIVEALVTELGMSKQEAACAEVAVAEAPSLSAGTSRASAIVAGLDCAREAKRTADEDRLLELALHDVADTASPLLPDDRSAVYEQILETKKDRGDAASVHAVARSWATFLDGETQRAKTSDARASLDPWVLAASIALGDPARAIPSLEQSERDFPGDYNPPARLGRAYLELKRFDDAARAADRAIARVYGPRAMRVYGLKADIAKARGDRAAEVSALERALARSENSVLTQGQSSVRDALAKRLAKLR